MRQINLLFLKKAIARAPAPEYNGQHIKLEVPARFEPDLADLQEMATDATFDTIMLIAKPYAEGSRRWFEWHLVMS